LRELPGGFCVATAEGGQEEGTSEKEQASPHGP
jgi:hypothetical protein